MRVHLKIDTGLHRNGVRPEEWGTFVSRAAGLEAEGVIDVEGVWSHIAEASDAEDDVARAVGLPGVLAHGMLTMGFSVQPVVDWVGDPGRVADYQVRFTRPVPVDPERGAEVGVTATVGALDHEARTARIDLKVVFGGQTVLGKSQLVVAFA